MQPDSPVSVGPSRDDRILLLRSIVIRPEGGGGVSSSILQLGGNVEVKVEVICEGLFEYVTEVATVVMGQLQGGS